LENLKYIPTKPVKYPSSKQLSKMSAYNALFETVRSNLDPEDFANVLTKARRTGLLLKNDENLADTMLAGMITDYPALFKVYLDEDFGTAHLGTILDNCYRKGDPALLKQFLKAPQIASAISRRTMFWPNRFGRIRTNEACWKILLDLPSFDITASDLIMDMWQMTTESIITILRHPRHSHLLYGLPNPVEWQKDLSRRLYGEESLFNSKPTPEYMEQAHRMMDIISSERRYRTQRLIRFIFWTSVLKVRAREFVERYWAPGGKKSMELKDSFTQNQIAV
jgi:hypothetical protein